MYIRLKLAKRMTRESLECAAYAIQLPKLAGKDEQSNLPLRIEPTAVDRRCGE